LATVEIHKIGVDRVLEPEETQMPPKTEKQRNVLYRTTKQRRQRADVFKSRGDGMEIL
jgi:hypothetical protein